MDNDVSEPATAHDPPSPRPAHSVMLLRVTGRSSATVALRSTQSVIEIELDPPLSPRSHLNAQGINALSPVQATVWLGPYSTGQRRFTRCCLDARLPETKYDRVAYSQRNQ